MSLQVCHHSDCQDKNSHRPLMLCEDCDTQIHNKPENAGHLRFDILPKKGRKKHSILLQIRSSFPGVEIYKTNSVLKCETVLNLHVCIW